MKNSKRILVPTRKGYVSVYTENILYISAEDKCIVIYGKNGGKLEVSLSLKTVIEELDNKYFFKCHKSFIVNLNYIESINIEYKKIKLLFDKEIPLAKRRKKEFKSKLSAVANSGAKRTPIPI